MTNLPLVLTPLTSIPLIQEGDDLPCLLWDALQREGIQLCRGDILVITQKIISKAEGRMVDLESITPSARAIEVAALANKDARLVELILHESSQIIRVTQEVIVVEHRLGFICANAGIDQSNVDFHQRVLLLPLDADNSAAKIRQALEERSDVRLGVVIIDTQGRAWRMGVVGMAIGLSGVAPLVDMRGEVDLFGKPLRLTLVAAVDELAAAASLMMGQAAEGRPLVHVRGFPYPLKEGSFSSLLRDRATDLFR